MVRSTASKAARTAKPHDERLVALFLDMLAAERGAEKNTLAAYGRDLADFISYLGGVGRSVASAATGDLRAYLSDLAKRDLRPATVARRLSAVRQLYRFLYAEGRRKDDPAAVLEGPKRVRGLPKTLTLGEVDRLLRVAAECDPAAPLSVRLRTARLACLVELLYATGLRVSELVALPASAARRDARVIVVRGKGNKERLVPLNDAAKEATAQYLAACDRSARRRRRCRRIEMAIPIVRRFRASHQAAFCPRAQSARCGRRIACGAIKPPRAAPRLCQSPSAQWRGSPRGPDAARSCRHFHDADLHPRARRTAEKPRPRFASIGRR